MHGISNKLINVKFKTLFLLPGKILALTEIHGTSKYSPPNLFWNKIGRICSQFKKTVFL